MMTIGSLFSGIGGLELGLERTGQFRTIWNCEIDPWASAVLKKHWPGVENLGDITKIEWQKVPRPDIVVGGFPCQDISHAGKGAGIREGKRSSLWVEYAKAIRVLRPRFALIENVPALTYRGLELVLADLAEVGYDAEWEIISASDVGAPHLRERIFIVAYPNPERQQQPQGSIEEERGWIGDGGQEISNRPRLGCERGGPARDWKHGLENADSDGGGQALPNGKDDGLGRWLEQPQEGQERRHVAHSHLQGLERRVFTRKCGDRLAAWARRNSIEGCWRPDPSILRVAHGVPHRMERIKCCGNAVVPQVAQAIGEMILESGLEG